MAADGVGFGDSRQPVLHPNPRTMIRPQYFVRVNGIAASADMTQDRAMKAADRAHAARPDAVISIVQVHPETRQAFGEFVLYCGA